MKKALITGISGQDGSYLAELLLSKGYRVFGIEKAQASFNNITHIQGKLDIRSVCMTDSLALTHLLHTIKPDEIYNLAAQSHVADSFKQPELTADVNALGTTRLLEAIRSANLTDTTKFYQASSSELFGNSTHGFQDETTPFHPQSPYAVSKIYAYWMTKNYRQAYGIFASNGILFNHESPRRGERFVTRKITRGLTRIAQGLQECLYLGNMNAKRDWGHAKDYVEMQWLMLQQNQPDDFVIASGKQHSVRDFVQWTAQELGIDLVFQGTSLDEIGIVKSVTGTKAPKIKAGNIILRIDPACFRPIDVEALVGNPAKAKHKLGWQPKISAQDLCKEMVEEDLKIAHTESIYQANINDLPIAV